VLAGTVGDLVDGREGFVDGGRVSRTSMSAIDMLSASSTSSATSGAVSSGSGSQEPT
jgi:hypothetical protein